MSEGEREQELLTAEYVLGTLDADAARTLEQAARTDAALAAAIAHWEEWLLPLSDLAPPATPPEDLWPTLETDIDGSRREPLARPHWQAASQRHPGGIGRAWRSAGLWRAAALLLAVATGALAWYAGTKPQPGAADRVLALATMTAPGGAVPVAVAELAGGVLTIRPTAGAAAPNAPALGLWALPKGAAEPRLLGLIPAAGGALPAPDLPTGSTVMVTAEPRGGPGARARPGPTLFAGTVARLE